jgi:hypothetical protein
MFLAKDYPNTEEWLQLIESLSSEFYERHDEIPCSIWRNIAKCRLHMHDIKGAEDLWKD